MVRLMAIVDRMMVRNTLIPFEIIEAGASCRKKADV